MVLVGRINALFSRVQLNRKSMMAPCRPGDIGIVKNGAGAATAALHLVHAAVWKEYLSHPA